MMHATSEQPSVERRVEGVGRVTQPMLIIYHENDGCAYTPASSAQPARKLFSGAKTVDVRILKGGSAGSGDPCHATSHHGFLGLDDEVVAAITGWLRGL